MKRFILLLFLSGLFASVAAAQPSVFVVRHAEKENAGNDPDLSEAGRARAEALAKTLKDAGITAIYATEFKRTQQTAAPLARVLGLEVTIVPAKDGAALLGKLRNAHGNVLVVGHGNTIPDLVKGIGIAAPINIGEQDYDNLFVLVPGDNPRFIHLHYP